MELESTEEKSSKGSSTGFLEDNMKIHENKSGIKIKYDNMI